MTVQDIIDIAIILQRSNPAIRIEFLPENMRGNEDIAFFHVLDRNMPLALVQQELTNNNLAFVPLTVNYEKTLYVVISAF